jgi:hypothetical protein
MADLIAPAIPADIKAAYIAKDPAALAKAIRAHPTAKGIPADYPDQRVVTEFLKNNPDIINNKLFTGTSPSPAPKPSGDAPLRPEEMAGIKSGITVGLGSIGISNPLDPKGKGPGSVDTPILEGARKKLGEIASSPFDVSGNYQPPSTPSYDEQVKSGKSPAMARVSTWLADAPEHARTPAELKKLRENYAQTAKFQKGLTEGAVDVGVDMTSPKNLALLAATFMRAPKLMAKFPKLFNVMKGGLSGKFAYDSLGDLSKEIPALKTAWDAHDPEGMGKALVKSVADLFFGVHAVEGAAEAANQFLPRGPGGPPPPPGKISKFLRDDSSNPPSAPPPSGAPPTVTSPLDSTPHPPLPRQEDREATSARYHETKAAVDLHTRRQAD